MESTKQIMARLWRNGHSRRVGTDTINLRRELEAEFYRRGWPGRVQMYARWMREATCDLK